MMSDFKRFDMICQECEYLKDRCQCEVDIDW